MQREVFEKYQPTVVFHAAAYKHVAMLETHPLESVRNNIVGIKPSRGLRPRWRIAAAPRRTLPKGKEAGYSLARHPGNSVRASAVVILDLSAPLAVAPIRHLTDAV